MGLKSSFENINLDTSLNYDKELKWLFNLKYNIFQKEVFYFLLFFLISIKNDTGLGLLFYNILTLKSIYHIIIALRVKLLLSYKFKVK